MNFELSSCQGFGKGIEEDKIKAPETPSLSIQGEDEDISAKKVILLVLYYVHLEAMTVL